MQPGENHLLHRSGPPRVASGFEALVGSVLLVLATLAAYAPALPGDVLWDDDQYVSANPLLTAPDGLWRIWTHPRESPQYYPLVFTSFWLEARLWGLSTFALHLVNVLLHAANALLLWRLLRRLGVPGAGLAAALFALHPVHVESVAWITERKNVLSGLFYLLSASAYLGFAERRRPFRFPRLVGVRYALAFLLFVCALLSKTVTCTLPITLLLVLWWKQGYVGRAEGLRLLPFLGVALIAGAATVLVEKHQVGAVGEDWVLTWPQRFLLANHALWFYAGKLLWPIVLSFNYPRWSIDATEPFPYVFAGLTVAAVALLYGYRRRIGRAPLAALGCFVLGLAPVLGFLNVYYFRYSYVADHFQYHASMGFLALLAALVDHVLGRLRPESGIGSIGLRRLGLLLPLACGVLTFRQAGLYTDVETLWHRTLTQNPRSVLAHHNLALLLVRGHEDDPQAIREAQEHFRALLDINSRCLDAHLNLGTLASRLGRHEEAVEHYRAALNIDPHRSEVLYNLGLELERTGDLDGALENYRACVDLDSTCTPALNALGRLYRARSERGKAWDQFQAALRADPKNAPALRNLGILCEDDGRYAEAVEYYQAALSLDPGMAEAWVRMGVCRRRTGDLTGAENAYRRALELHPTYFEALGDLAGMAYAAGRFEDAAAGYRRALELKPRDVGLRVNLAVSYQQLGEYAQAVRLLEEGLRDQAGQVTLMHELAKVLATAPDDSVRDGARALELATAVVERLEAPRPEAFRTLAAAYAAVGEYEPAVEAIQRAVELARSLGMTELENQLFQQLLKYQDRVSAPAHVPKSRHVDD